MLSQRRWDDGEILTEDPHEVEGWPSICRQAAANFPQFTLAEQADVFGVSRSTWWRWLAGTHCPRKREARQFAARGRLNERRVMYARARTEAAIRARRRRR